MTVAFFFTTETADNLVTFLEDDAVDADDTVALVGELTGIDVDRDCPIDGIPISFLIPVA